MSRHRPVSHPQSRRRDTSPSADTSNTCPSASPAGGHRAGDRPADAMPADASSAAGTPEGGCRAEGQSEAERPAGEPAAAPREDGPREAGPQAGARREDGPRVGAPREDGLREDARQGDGLQEDETRGDGLQEDEAQVGARQRAGPDASRALWQRDGQGGRRAGLDADAPSLPADACSAGHENLRPDRRHALRPGRCALPGGRHFPLARTVSPPPEQE